MTGSASATAVDTALDGAVEFFRERETRQGVIARRLLGQPRREDTVLTDHLIRERRRKTRMDGSIDGALVPTAWAAWELLELGCPPDHAAVVRTLGYVLGAQDAPGYFGEGCTNDRHRRRLCRHYLSGFFSPGSRDVEIAPLVFPSGVAVAGDDHARFAASCFALRSALRGGAERRAAIARHVDALLDLDALWRPAGDWPPNLVLFALGAVAFAPLGAGAKVERLAAGVLGGQAPGDGWPGADPWHAFDMLLHLPPSRVRPAARQAVPFFTAAQRADGGFGAATHEEHSLIAVRALLLARA